MGGQGAPVSVIGLSGLFRAAGLLFQARADRQIILKPRALEGKGVFNPALQGFIGVARVIKERGKGVKISAAAAKREAAGPVA